MEKQCIEIAELIKKIMGVGFEFKQACKIYEIAESRIASSENLNFINEIFEINQGKTKASDCYEHYILWANDNNITPMTLTKFGIVMSRFIQKTKTTDGFVYNCILK